MKVTISPFANNQKYPRIIIKPGREAALLRGHPWLFSGAVTSVEGDPEPGETVVAVTHSGAPLAIGFFNPLSEITFRLLTTDTTATVDHHFWRQRIRSAVALRQKVVPPQTTAYRLINAEGDRMPGLVVDRYGDYLVFSVGTAGVEKCRQTVLDVLIEEIKPLGIYEHSEGRARQLEGLEDRVCPVYGRDIPETVEITENNLYFEVNIVSGQKTGFFLDQRPNRELIEHLSYRAMVLDCFSYTGAFSVYSARGGAKKVISIETSAQANELAKRNLEINGFSPGEHPIIRADVFAYLRETDELFDLIILDPPAFAKSKRDVARSARGYKDINLYAMRRLTEGGILATFSCSNHIDEALFEKIVLSAVRDAGKTAQILGKLGPGPDHPTNLAHREGRYLKGLLLSISTS